MAVFYYNTGNKLFTFGESTSGTREARIEQVTVSESPEYADGGMIQVGRSLSFNVTGWIVGSDETDLKNKIRLARESLTDSGVYLEYQHKTGTPSYLFSPGRTATESNNADPSARPSRGTPKPVKVDFKRFAGDRTVSIEFQVEVFSTDTFGAGFPEGVRSMWYDTRITYDENYVPSQVVAGTLEVTESFDRYSIPKYIDQFFPLNAKQRGNKIAWKRAPVEYQWSSTGHTIEFAFTDKMLRRSFPPPITSGDCKVKLSSTLSRTVKTLTGWFEAPPDASTTVMIAEAYKILNARFDVFGLAGNRGGSDFLTDLSITVDLFRSRIDFSFTAKVLGTLVTQDNVTKFLGEPSVGGKPEYKVPDHILRHAGKTVSVLGSDYPTTQKNETKPTLRKDGGGSASTEKQESEDKRDYVYIDERVLVEEDTGKGVDWATGPLEGFEAGLIIATGKVRRERGRGQSRLIYIRSGVRVRVNKECEVPPPGDGTWTISSQKVADPQFSYLTGRVWQHGNRDGVLEGTTYNAISFAYVYEGLKGAGMQYASKWNPHTVPDAAPVKWDLLPLEMK